MDTAPKTIDRRLTLVSETPTEDGMVDLTFDIDPAFEAELQAAADARGKDLSTFLRDALLEGIRREVTQGVADGRVQGEEASHLLGLISTTLGEDGASGHATSIPGDEHPDSIGAPV